MRAHVSNSIRTQTIALGAASFMALGGALTLGTSPAAAAPIGANAIALSEAAPGEVIHVGKRWKKWRGHSHRGWGKHAIAGLALGIIGAGIASHYYGGYPYAYGHYAYGPGRICHKYGRVIVC